MNIECSWNTFDDGDWWYDLGLSYCKTKYHKQNKNVFTIGLLLLSIYIRW